MVDDKWYLITEHRSPDGITHTAELVVTAADLSLEPIETQCNHYLDELKKEGFDMFVATSKLAKKFNISSVEARKILLSWLKTEAHNEWMKNETTI